MEGAVPWVYLDDHWDEHPKILAAFGEDPLAPVLFIRLATQAVRERSAPFVAPPRASHRLDVLENVELVLRVRTQLLLDPNLWWFSLGPVGRTKIPLKTRAAVYTRDGLLCGNCRATENLSIDHRLPVSRGGTNDIENLWVLCLPCNMDKRTKTVEEWLG